MADERRIRVERGTTDDGAGAAHTGQTQVRVQGEGVHVRDHEIPDVGIAEAHRAFGGIDLPATLVGMLTALALAALLDVDMPIAQEVHNALFEGKSVQRCLLDLLSREQKDELADYDAWLNVLADRARPPVAANGGLTPVASVEADAPVG